MIFMTVVLFGTGVFLLLSDRWMPRLAKIMSFSLPQPSPMFRIGVWKLRSLGIFHIVLSIFIFVAIAVPSVGPSLPFGVLYIPLLAYLLLGWVMIVLSIMNKKRDSRNGGCNHKSSTSSN